MGVATYKCPGLVEVLAMLLEKGLFLLGAAVVCIATPLDDYVNHDDGMFNYVEIREPFFGEVLTMYFVNLTSQRWLTRTKSNVTLLVGKG